MFTLTLVTPEKKIMARQEIEEIFVPAFRGELNILPGHAPLMTTLSTGVLRYRLKGEKDLQPIAISWGYCEVTPGGVNVLAETAERPDEIDLDRAADARTRAEQALASVDLSPDEFAKYQNKIVRSLIREEVGRSANKQ